MRFPRFTTLQLLLAATLVALLVGLFTSAWRAGKPQHVQHVCFSPNGDYLAALYSGGRVRVWRMHKDRPRLVAQAFGEAPIMGGDYQSIHFLDNRRLLKVESVDPFYGQPRATAKILEVTSGKTSEAISIDVPYLKEDGVAASGNRLFVAGSHNDYGIYCYDLDERQLERKINVGAVGVWILAVSRDGSTLATKDSSCNVHVFDVASGQKLRSFPYTLCGVLAITADGSRVATIDREPPGQIASPRAVIFDTRTANPPEEFPELGDSYMGWMAFSNDGSRLAAMGFDAGLFDVPTKELRRRIPAQAFKTAHREQRSTLPNPIASWSAISPGGEVLVTCCDEGLIFWDFETGKIQHVVRGDSRFIRGASFVIGFAIWAATWGIIRKRAGTSLAKKEPCESGSDSPLARPKLSAPLAMKFCWGLMIVGGLVALGIPIVLVFTLGPWLFPTIYFSLFVGLAAIARGAARDSVGLKRTAGLQMANMIALDLANVIFAAMEFALLRSRSVRDYLAAQNR